MYMDILWIYQILQNGNPGQLEKANFTMFRV